MTLDIPHNVTGFDMLIDLKHLMPMSTIYHLAGGNTLLYPDVTSQTTIPNILSRFNIVGVNATHIKMRSGNWVPGTHHYFIIDYVKTA